MFVAHRNAHKHLVALQDPDVVVPDLIVDDASSRSSWAARGSTCSTPGATTRTTRS